MTSDERTPAPLVLIVEDELAVRRVLKVALAAEGFRTLEAGNGADALVLAASHVPDVVLLDLGLPDRDGVGVTRELRTWTQVPIVVVSARGQEDQKVAALDAGADDYVTKPFGVAELTARVRVALRHASRAGAAPGGIFESGPLWVDLGRRLVRVAGQDVHLTRIEYKLLTTLIEDAGRVVTHRKLLSAVWGPHGGRQNHYLRVYMTHLRRKLQTSAVSEPLFDTEIGVGYRLRTDAGVS